MRVEEAGEVEEEIEVEERRNQGGRGHSLQATEWKTTDLNKTHRSLNIYHHKKYMSEKKFLLALGVEDLNKNKISLPRCCLSLISSCGPSKKLSPLEVSS